MRISPKSQDQKAFSDLVGNKMKGLFAGSPRRLIAVGVDDSGKLCMVGDLSGCGKTVVDAGLCRVYDMVRGVMDTVNPLVEEACG